MNYRKELPDAATAALLFGLIKNRSRIHVTLERTIMELVISVSNPYFIVSLVIAVAPKYDIRKQILSDRQEGTKQ